MSITLIKPQAKLGACRPKNQHQHLLGFTIAMGHAASICRSSKPTPLRYVVERKLTDLRAGGEPVGCVELARLGDWTRVAVKTTDLVKLKVQPTGIDRYVQNKTRKW